MNEYQRLEAKLINYLSRTEIKRTDSIISFYDLYKTIEDKFKILRNIQLDNQLIDKINKDNLQTRSTEFVTHYLDNILATTEGTTSKITFFYGMGRNPETFTILKDFDDNDIYFSSNTKPNKDFITKYYEDIIFIFKNLEDYAKLTKGDIGINKENPNLRPMLFTDGFLTISINYSNYGQVSTEITINKEEDQTAIYKREWYTRKKLADFVSENSDEILKKIPVNISDLNPSYQEMLFGQIKNN